MVLNEAAASMLIEKWDQKGFKVSEITDEMTRKNTAILLENEHRYMIEASTTTQDIGQFKKMLMPLTRRIMPNLIANEIVGVQPMRGPVGQAFAWRVKAGTTVGTYTADSTELGYNTVDKSFSGSMPTTAAERRDSTDPASTGAISRIKATIEQTTVEAEDRLLKTEYSIQAAQDMKAMHGEDVEARMVEFLQYEIQQEIDRELIDRINTLATTYGSTYTVSASDGQWEAEKFRTLYTRIVKAASNIATRTRRGAGNIIIASSNVVTALDSLGNFLIQPTGSSPMELAPGVAKVGTIENRFAVYRDTFATEDYATVGYKGPGPESSGVIFCPYVPLMIGRAVREDNPFYPVIAMLTRYGVVDNLFGGENYYEKLTVDFNGIF